MSLSPGRRKRQSDAETDLLERLSREYRGLKPRSHHRFLRGSNSTATANILK